MVITDRAFIERFQRLKALDNLIKEKHAMRTYRHTNQWYNYKEKKKIIDIYKVWWKNAHALTLREP